MTQQSPGISKGMAALLAAGAALTVGIILISTMKPRTPHDEQTSEYVKTAQWVNIDTLFSEYVANEVGADEAYRHKRIRTTGTVRSISRSAFSDAPHVEVGGQSQKTSASLFFKKSEDPKVGRLSVGGSVTAECECSGKTMGSPVLRDCEVYP